MPSCNSPASASDDTPDLVDILSNIYPGGPRGEYKYHLIRFAGFRSIKPLLVRRGTRMGEAGEQKQRKEVMA